MKREQSLSQNITAVSAALEVMGKPIPEYSRSECGPGGNGASPSQNVAAVNAALEEIWL